MTYYESGVTAGRPWPLQSEADSWVGQWVRRTTEEPNMGGRVERRLTALAVQKIKSPGLHCVDDNLYLQVIRSRSGKEEPNKSWLFRYRIAGRVRDMGLGPL